MHEKEIIKYSKQDRINFIHARLANLRLTKNIIKQVLDADEELFRILLVGGDDVSLGGIGSLKIRTKTAREEHIWHKPKFDGTGFEDIFIPFCDEYNVVRFKPSRSFKEELKQSTYGDAIIRKKHKMSETDEDYDDEDDFDENEVIEYGS